MKTLEGSSKFVLESNNSIFKLTEEFDGPFDELIQTRWLHLVTVFVKPKLISYYYKWDKLGAIQIIGGTFWALL